MSDEPMRRRSIESQLHDDLVVDTCEQPGDEHRLARAVGGALATGGGLAALWLALRSITASKVVVIAIGTAAATSATAWVIARSQQDGITVGATSAAPAGDTIAGVDATQTRATQPQPPATLEVIHEPAVPSSPAASSTGATRSSCAKGCGGISTARSSTCLRRRSARPGRRCPVAGTSSESAQLRSVR